MEQGLLSASPHSAVTFLLVPVVSQVTASKSYYGVDTKEATHPAKPIHYANYCTTPPTSHHIPKILKGTISLSHRLLTLLRAILNHPPSMSFRRDDGLGRESWSQGEPCLNIDELSIVTHRLIMSPDDQIKQEQDIALPSTPRLNALLSIPRIHIYKRTTPQHIVKTGNLGSRRPGINNVNVSDDRPSRRQTGTPQPV